MLKQRLLGRAQARQGRMSRKAKRGVCYDRGRKRLASTEPIKASLTVRESGLVVEAVIVRAASGEKLVTHRQWYDQDGLGDIVRQGIGGNKLTELSTANLPNVETEYFVSRSYLQVRLVEDKQTGSVKAARERLFQLAEQFKFGARSTTGPIAHFDEDARMVDIKLPYEPPIAGDKLTAEITHKCRGWGVCQSRTDRRMFLFRSCNGIGGSLVWANAFVEKHSGDCFKLSSLSRAATDALVWSGLFEIREIFRPLPGNGTNQHAREFHPVRESSTKKQAARRAALRAHRMEYGVGTDDHVVLERAGYDIDRAGTEAKIQFGKSAFATRDREKPVETGGVTVSAKRREAEFYAMYGRKRVRLIPGPQGKIPG